MFPEKVIFCEGNITAFPLYILYNYIYMYIVKYNNKSHMMNKTQSIQSSHDSKETKEIVNCAEYFVLP